MALNIHNHGYTTDCTLMALTHEHC